MTEKLKGKINICHFNFYRINGTTESVVFFIAVHIILSRSLSCSSEWLTFIYAVTQRKKWHHTREFQRILFEVKY